jgi:hypothetical protein
MTPISTTAREREPGRPATTTLRSSTEPRREPRRHRLGDQPPLPRRTPPHTRMVSPRPRPRYSGRTEVQNDDPAGGRPPRLPAEPERRRKQRQKRRHGNRSRSRRQRLRHQREHGQLSHRRRQWTGRELVGRESTHEKPHKRRSRRPASQRTHAPTRGARVKTSFLETGSWNRLVVKQRQARPVDAARALAYARGLRGGCEVRPGPEAGALGRMDRWQIRSAAGWQTSLLRQRTSAPGEDLAA